MGITLENNGVIGSIEPFSLADRAGLKKGLKIISVNNIDVTNMKIKELSLTIKSNEHDLVIGAVEISGSLSSQKTNQNNDVIPFQTISPRLPQKISQYDNPSSKPVLNHNLNNKEGNKTLIEILLTFA